MHLRMIRYQEFTQVWTRNFSLAVLYNIVVFSACCALIMVSVCRQMTGCGLLWMGQFWWGVDRLILECGPITFACVMTLIDGSWIGRGWWKIWAEGLNTPHPELSTGQKLVDCSTGQTVCKSQLMRQVFGLCLWSLGNPRNGQWARAPWTKAYLRRALVEFVLHGRGCRSTFFDHETRVNLLDEIFPVHGFYIEGVQKNFLFLQFG